MERTIFKGTSRVTTTRYGLSPTLGYFPTDRVFLAALVQLENFSSEGNAGTSSSRSLLALGGGLGVDIRLGAASSLRPALYLTWVAEHIDPTNSSDFTWSRNMATVALHVLSHHIPHVFLGVGPRYDTSLSSEYDVGGTAPELHTFAFEGIIGIWW